MPTLPLTTALPATSSFWVGVLVPMPTLPLARYTSAPLTCQVPGTFTKLLPSSTGAATTELRVMVISPG